jgi:hypothetical protein
MRSATIAVLVFSMTVFVATGAAGTSGRTALTVVYRADAGSSVAPTRWTLRCAPARGTLPHPGVACRHLARGGPTLFAPVPRGIACTEIYGGPQVAVVTGTVAGKRISARLSREDGCQVARWNRLSPWLLPPGGVP